MFYGEKLPLTILISAFIIFAICGLVTVLKTTHSGIKMDMYLCVSDVPSAYYYNDSAYTTKEFYPREYIYDKNSNVNDICSYKRRDFKGVLTPLKYEKCKNIYNNTTKAKYNNNECKVLGKESYITDDMECSVFYVWGSKKLVSVSCEGSSFEQRTEAIKKIQKKYK